MFKGGVSVELEDASIPFDAVEWNIKHLITTMKLSALASSYNFRIDWQREIL